MWVYVCVLAFVHVCVVAKIFPFVLWYLDYLVLWYYKAFWKLYIFRNKQEIDVSQF